MRTVSVLSTVFLLVCGAGCPSSGEDIDPASATSTTSTTDAVGTTTADGPDPTGSTVPAGDSGDVSTGELVDPDAVLHGLCAQQLACECVTPAYPDVEACVADRAAELERLQQAAEAAGLRFDPTCVNAWAYNVEFWGCRAEEEDAPAPPTCAGTCAFVHGDQGSGEACVAHEDGSDCAQGLRCGYAGTCVVACGGQAGDPCELSTNCGDGLYCRAEDGVCAGATAEGEACEPDSGQCAGDLYCHGETGVCTALAGLGGACGGSTYCAEGTGCSASQQVCVAPAGVNESCEDAYVCVPEAVCLTDENGSSCWARRAAGESCAPSAALCAEGSTCQDEVCVADEPWVCG